MNSWLDGILEKKRNNKVHLDAINDVLEWRDNFELVIMKRAIERCEGLKSWVA